MSITGRRSALSDLTVVIDEMFPVDAGHIGSVLVSSSKSTHENLFARVAELFPAEHIDDVTALVRKHAPHAPSLEGLSQQLADISPDWTWREPAADITAAQRRKRLRIAGAAIVGVVGAAAVGAYFGLSALDEPSLLASQEFSSLTTAAGLSCKALDETNAECRNVSAGTIWRVTALPGATDNDPDTFRFSRGNQLGLVLVFKDDADRAAYPPLAGFQRIYPYLSSRDRVTVGATDGPVIEMLAQAVDRSVLAPGRGLAVTKTTNAGPRVSEALGDWPTKIPTGQIPWPQATPSTSPSSAASSSSSPSSEGSSPADPYDSPVDSPAPEQSSSSQTSGAARPAASDPEPSPSSPTPSPSTTTEPDTGTPTPPDDQPAQPSKGDPGDKTVVTIRLPLIGIGLG